nr:GntR family transcriptional regulator [Paenibacillus mendelii]
MNSINRVPLYKKIQDYVRELIQSENLAAGDRIPTERELMERFHVSKITVVNALSALAAENVISRVRGRGSFVGSLPEEPPADKYDLVMDTEKITINESANDSQKSP